MWYEFYINVLGELQYSNGSAEVVFASLINPELTDAYQLLWNFIVLALNRKKSQTLV